jgi:hypothetical protein
MPTQAERQALYQKDCDIINRKADAKVLKLLADFKKVEGQHVNIVRMKSAEIDKKTAAKVKGFSAQQLSHEKLHMGASQAIKDAWTKRYKDLIEKAELDGDQEKNHITEEDMRSLDRIKATTDKAINRIETWRKSDLASELLQLQRHTQRPRKE